MHPPVPAKLFLSILSLNFLLYHILRLFGTDLLKTYWAHDVEMTSMRRRYVASTSLRRHVPAGNLAPPCPPPFPQYSKPWPPNILNLPTPMCLLYGGSACIFL